MFAQMQPPFAPDGQRWPHPLPGGDGEALRRIADAADDVHRFLAHVAATTWWNGCATGIVIGLLIAAVYFLLIRKRTKP